MGQVINLSFLACLILEKNILLWEFIFSAKTLENKLWLRKLTTKRQGYQLWLITIATSHIFMLNCLIQHRHGKPWLTFDVNHKLTMVNIVNHFHTIHPWCFSIVLFTQMAVNQTHAHIYTKHRHTYDTLCYTPPSCSILVTWFPYCASHNSELANEPQLLPRV